ncbi:MFS transporter [Breznakiella homolactica]|uniref:MFS transporter n=1 Tax=Breznakiella homolactica TaxID=2798577 RepID=A0A7T7XN98_9SPIR|nr:MFS transporter [Breznakiella homolactica]QQO09428.1 MFS transporter [Breznakiella homolactica]
MGSDKGKVYFIYSLLVLSYFFSLFFRVSASVALPLIQAEWGLSAGIIGFISSMYFYTYALMQPACGVLNDTYSPMKVVAIGLVIAGIGSLIFGLAANTAALITGRLLMGIGLSPILSGLLVYQGSRFPPERYAFFSGLSMMIGNMGAVFSAAPLSAALGLWGRAGVFCAICITTVLVSVLLLVFGGRTPQEKTGRSLGREIFSRFVRAAGVLRVSRELKIVVLMWMVSFGAIMAYQGLWAVSWFAAVYPGLKHWASAAATVVSIGVMTGNFAGGFICRNAASRHHVIRRSLFAVFFLWIGLILSFYLVLPMGATVLVSFLLGACSGIAFTQFTAAVHEIAPEGQGGAVFGVSNCIIFLCIILYQWGSGILIGAFQRHTGNGFTAAFSIICATLLIPCAAAFRMRPIERVTLREPAVSGGKKQP